MNEVDCCWIAGIEAIEASRRRRLRRLWRHEEHDVDDECEDELELRDRATDETSENHRELHLTSGTYISTRNDDVYSLTDDRCHVYGVPTTAKYRLVLDRFCRRNQNLRYSFDNPAFVHGLVTAQSVSHYWPPYPSIRNHPPRNVVSQHPHPLTMNTYSEIQRDFRTILFWCCRLISTETGLDQGQRCLFRFRDEAKTFIGRQMPCSSKGDCEERGIAGVLHSSCRRRV